MPIAVTAEQLGYNAIRFPSQRDSGINLFIINNFEKLLSPKNITHVDGQNTYIRKF